ncbi:MAG: heme-binding domain-containing protein [Leeuwenhoekiella sp.]
MIWLKRFLILALIALVGIQFIRPEKNNEGYESLKPYITETKPTKAVQQTLQTACYDCHSNQTEYPWYAQVAPVSFFLASHIKDGKRHLNFSDWDKYDAKRKDKKLSDIIEQVEAGEMPLSSYTLIHKDAVLSTQETEALLTWAKVARLNYSSARLPQ